MASIQSYETSNLVKRRDAFYKLVSREIELLNQRTNMFLVYNTILMVGLGLGRLNGALSLVVIGSGLLSSFIWIYLGNLGLILEDFFWDKAYMLEDDLDPDEKIYSQFKVQRKTTRRYRFFWRSSVYIGRILPPLWLLTWGVVLVTALFN